MSNLKDKAISISGKKYILVSDRVVFFNETYPNGCISTEIIPDENAWIIKASVTPDISEPKRVFTGYSQAVEGSSNINKTSALENAETSAVGRALGFMGIGVIESIASADEIHKAKNRQSTQPNTGEKHETTCSKCGAIVQNPDIKDGKYGAYFACPHCYQNSKFTPAKVTEESLKPPF